jgi:hypothetical protein
MRRGSRKGREITALAQLWDAQLNGAGAGLPDPITVPIAVIDPLRAALAMRRAGHALDFQLHQALRSKTHHLAQQIGVRALLQQRAKAHHLVGHRRFSGSVDRFGDQTLPKIRDDHRCG